MLVEKSTLVDNRYLLQEQVGPGGPIELYFAQDRQLQRSVVIEMLSERAATDKALCDKFHLHQRTVSAIHHPNVLEIYDAGEWNGRPYLVMERDAGQLSVGDSSPGMRTDPAIAVKMMRQAADGLHYCRRQRLAAWPFSYEAVRIGTSGNAHLALLEDSLFGETDSRFVSRGEKDDPSALSALLRLLLSGTPDAKDMQPFISALPASVAELLRRLESGTPDSFTNAGEVAEAIRAIEAASMDYTQANFVVDPVPTPPDFQRTSSLAEAPTLAVSQQSAVPSMPYVPAIKNGAANSTLAAPVRSSVATSGNGRPYAPVSTPARRRRFAPFVVLPLLGILLLVAGVLFLAGQRDNDSPLISNNNLAALPTSTATSLPLAALPTSTVTAVLVAAPELRGKSLEEATSSANELGIQLSVIDPLYSEDVLSDKVATQDPAPGTQLQLGAAITVALSLGPAPQEEDDGEESAAPLPAATPVEPRPDQKQSPGKKDKGKKK